MATCAVSINFSFNPQYETAHIPGEKLNTLLDHSKACFHIYSYLCLKAEKRHDIGIVRKINNKKIADSLNMSLRTVQHCMKQMYNSNLLSIKLQYKNKVRDKDIYLEGYQEMYENNNYIKLPEEFFSKEFLSSDKGSITLAVGTFSSIYKNVLAQLQILKGKNKSAQNHELLNKVKVHREFLETTLLSKMKRVCVDDLEKAIEEVKKLGIEILVDESKRDGSPKYIVAAYKVIRKMFTPRNNRLSVVKKYPLAFESVNDWLAYTGLSRIFIYQKELEDLTQMLLQYGHVPLLAGLIKFKEYALHKVDEIPSRCGYVRTCIEEWLAPKKHNNSSN
ncbi:hypothetical protein [Wukongibacter baidiensis]